MALAFLSLVVKLVPCPANGGIPVSRLEDRVAVAVERIGCPCAIGNRGLSCGVFFLYYSNFHNGLLFPTVLLLYRYHPSLVHKLASMMKDAIAANPAMVHSNNKQQISTNGFFVLNAITTHVIYCTFKSAACHEHGSFFTKVRGKEEWGQK